MDTSSLPVVSVVLPVRNEADHIYGCLDAILAQDYPPDRFEVIVADGASEDGTARVVAGYAERDPRVRLVANPERIVPVGLNVAIRAARGQVVARVDGHTRIAADYLRRGVEALARTGADNVGGPMTPVGGGVFGDAVAAAMSSRFGIGAYFHFGAEECAVDTVYLGMWPRRVFETVGLFDEELVRNQDDEFNYRLRKAGGKVVFVPAMRSQYQNRRTVAALARQFYEYGEWKVRVLQRHAGQMSPRHAVPPAFVGALACAAILAGEVPHAAAAGLTLALVYAAGVLCAAGINAGGGGWRPWLATALAFAVIHLAWGSGFLAGLLRFADRWRRPADPPPVLDAGPGSPGEETEKLQSFEGERQ